MTFKCSGSSQPPPSTLDSHVDPHTGIQLQEVTATISKDLVYEYFGKSPFKCECHAWSPRSKAKSQSATIEVACKCCAFHLNQFLSAHPRSFVSYCGARETIELRSECNTTTSNCVRKMRDWEVIGNRENGGTIGRWYFRQTDWNHFTQSNANGVAEPLTTYLDQATNSLVKNILTISTSTQFNEIGD